MGKIYISGSCKPTIYSSKLFRSSSRKEKIRASLESPVNAELIKQLDEYIGDEYKQKNTPKKTDKSAEDEFFDNDQGNNDSSSETSEDASHSGGNFGLSEKYGDDLDAEGAAAFDDTQVSESDESEETDDSDSSAEASVNIKKPYIQADTIITKPFVENHVTLSGLAGELKGTLNARADTSGVVRVSVKNDEVWIYYNDNTNLNNVMSPVIEIINAANYQYLIFNRLARTDNAIVFTINCNDTLNLVESVNNEK